MKPQSLMIVAGLAALALPALAQVPAFTTATSGAAAGVQTPQDLLNDLQNRISGDAAKGLLKPENVSALEGKQQELENRVARLRGTNLTRDEQSALLLGIKQQQARLVRYEQGPAALQKKTDPSSLPPPTYITPNGTAIIAPGGNYGNSGVVLPPNGPAMNPAPANLQPVAPVN